MKNNLKFVNALKKYAKVGCLVLLVGVASGKAWGQCPLPANYTHPLKDMAASSYLLPVNGGRVFGASRDWSSSCSYRRLHAGIDLCFSAGSGAGVPVYACIGGTVTAISTTFYAGTGAIYVHNDDGTYICYGEVKNSEKLKVGDRVEQGQKIAAIMANNNSGATMLHFEYYSGAAGSGGFSICNSGYTCVSGAYSRRTDLQNPTPFKDLPVDPNQTYVGNSANTSSALAITNLRPNSTYRVGEEINFRISGFTSSNIGTDIIRPKIRMLLYNPGDINNEGLNCYEYNAQCDGAGGYVHGASWDGYLSTNWENKWAEIRAHNTITGDSGQAVYVHIIPNSDPLGITYPADQEQFAWNPSLNINVDITIKGSTTYYTQCKQCGNCAPSIWEQWNRTIKVKAICLAGTPNFSNPLATESQAQLGTYTLIEAKHVEGVSNKYTIQNIPPGWNDHWVKIFVWKHGGESSDYAVRYIKIGKIPAGTIPSNNNLPNAGEVPDPSKKPVIKTTSQYCYREGSTVEIQVSNVAANDEIELIYCRLPYGSRDCDCPQTIIDNIDRFHVINTANSSTRTISFSLPASQHWDNKTLKIIVNNKTKGTWCWSNEIYRDVNNIQNLIREAFENTDFNWKFAYWLGKAANDSYDKDGNGINDAMVEMGFNVKRDSFNNVAFDIGIKNLDKAINGVKKVVLISIRGTNNATNWSSNLTPTPVRWDAGTETYTGYASSLIDGFTRDAEVHKGFYDIYKGIWTRFNNELYWNGLNYDNTLFIVTGHSLGGAIAELISLRLSEKLETSSNLNQILCYGFASPPVGDSDLRTYAGNGWFLGKKGTKVRDRIYKLSNSFDPVPNYKRITDWLMFWPNLILLNQWDVYSLAADKNTKTFNTLWQAGNQFGHQMEHVYLEYLKTKAAE